MKETILGVAESLLRKVSILSGKISLGTKSIDKFVKSLLYCLEGKNNGQEI